VNDNAKGAVAALRGYLLSDIPKRDIRNLMVDWADDVASSEII
jgi:hypothetical protein